MHQTDVAPPVPGEELPAHHGRPRSVAADDAILEAAGALLVEVGYRALCMEAIATRAHISKATLYRRYKSKESVVAAAVLASIGMAPADLPVPAASTREVLTYLLRVGSAVMTSPVWLPTVGAAFAEGSHEGGLVSTLRGQVFDPSAQLMIDAVIRAISGGAVRKTVEPEMVADLLFGAVLARTLSGKEVDEAWIDRIVSSVMAGIATGAR
jgi:AcrR family transcriptional regulator